MTTAAQRIDQLAGGYRQSAVIFAAVRIGLFAAIGRATKSLDELTDALGADPRGMRILCDALVSLELLEKRDSGYRIPADVAEVLLPGAAASRAAILAHGALLYERWGKLEDSVLNGQRAPGVEPDAKAPGCEKEFARAMADIGRQSADETAAVLPLEGAQRMLDLGGGPGLYAIACAKRNPKLHATVFDTAETLEVARESIAAAGLEQRVGVQPGDALNDTLGEGYDLILVSNFVHIFSDEQNRSTVARCARALNDGGRLAIKDFILDDSRVSPQWNALFAVNMLVGTETGDCYTRAQVIDWFESAALQFESEHSVGQQSSVLIARKAPAS